MSAHKPYTEPGMVCGGSRITVAASWTRSMLGKQFTDEAGNIRRVVAVCGWDGLKKDQQKAYAVANPWLHDSDRKRLQFVITTGVPVNVAWERTQFVREFREVHHASVAAASA